MQTRRVTGNFSVSGQLDPDDFASLAAQGVRLVINNRPDGEVPGQLATADASRLAAQAGLDYVALPVRMPSLDAEQIDRFGALCNQATGPVHAHCASGNRSATLFMLASLRRGALHRDDLPAWAAERQLDPTAALAWWDRHGG